jgi:hypothetical protein
MYRRFVVIRDHNGSGCAHTHDATSVIYHGEMDVEAKLLAVMSAVTCRRIGNMMEPAEKSRTSAQLNRMVLVVSSCLGFVQWELSVFQGIRIRASWMNARR